MIQENNELCAVGGSRPLGSRHSNSQISPTAPTLLGVVLSAATIAISAIGMSQPAEALPSFARQTGQPCGACHTDFPGLTPFGRQFKLGGYTLGGGKYRTALFPTGGDSTKALAAYTKNADGKAKKNAKSDETEDNGYLPPIAMMAMMGYTHTSAPQAGLEPYKPNDNLTLFQYSAFWGGAITDHIGAFAQLTYGGAPAGGTDPADPYSSYQWGWDNVDVRYSNTGKVGSLDVTYGITANNNPTIQDPWNTMPAWSFPYVESNVQPDPGASTLIDGGLEMHVASVGGYAYINNLVYLELSGYWALNRNTLAKLGTDPLGVPVVDGVAPYWRLAIEPHWGNNWFEFGTFGMTARVRPWWAFNGYDTPTDSNTDRYTDIGFDSQYQYQGDNYWITLRGSYIHEKQSLDASFNNANLDTPADNPTNTLNTLKLYGSLAYGNDNRFVLSGQYFDTWGSTDASFYAGDNNGFTAELAYIPYINSHPQVWPWANARVGIQYTSYNKFQGTSTNAHDNDTVLLYAWVAM
jgi:hypothetical protein